MPEMDVRGTVEPLPISHELEGKTLRGAVRHLLPAARSGQSKGMPAATPGSGQEPVAGPPKGAAGLLVEVHHPGRGKAIEPGG